MKINSPELAAPAAAKPERVGRWLAVLVVTVVTAVSYHNSIHGPLIFDDIGVISANATLDHFTTALAPPGSSGLAGRPVASLTFALNRALDGENVEGYHVFNLAIHLAAALVLLALMHRTLQSARLFARFGTHALPLATAIALLWAAHPVQTESVTYLAQRTESLMGFFYLLTLYAFVRGTSSPARRGWWVVAATSAILGALSKEIIVTVPVLTFLYDRTFISGTWRQALRRHWPGHLGIALCWGVIVWQLVGIDRGNVGLGLGTSAWNYALTSCRSITLYVQRSFWPEPLVLDYGTAIVAQLRDVWPQATGVVALVAATGFALWRRPILGFVGAWFLVILAPVSSFVPVLGQPTGEHRLYLSLAAVVTVVVLALYATLGRRAFAFCALLVALASGLTIRRNADYRSAIVLWSDNIAKAPEATRAYLSLGNAQALTDLAAAESTYRAGLKIDPAGADLHFALANLLAQDPARHAEAIAAYLAALRAAPTSTKFHVMLGNFYFNQQPDQMLLALGHYQAAVRLEPDRGELHHNAANALLRLPGRRAAALAEFHTALQLNPRLTDAHLALANALAEDSASFHEAAREFEATLELAPNQAVAHYNYAVLLERDPGRVADAIAHYETAVRLRPDQVPSRFNLGRLLARDPARAAEACAQFEAVLRLEPANAPARRMLGRLATAN